MYEHKINRKALDLMKIHFKHQQIDYNSESVIQLGVHYIVSISELIIKMNALNVNSKYKSTRNSTLY
jgi:hypothetical protein